MKNIYIMISQTQTGYAKVLRRVGGFYYNHASISLHESLDPLYGFARPSQHEYMNAKLVKESIDRYTLRQSDFVPVVVFRVPVTDEQYNQIDADIQRIMNDKEYLYNYYSVLTHPLTGGFRVDKSYSCIEFIMLILNDIGIGEDRKSYDTTPDDLLDILAEYKFYEGNLLDYGEFEESDGSYFAPWSMNTVVSNIKGFHKVGVRTLTSAVVLDIFDDIVPFLEIFD